MTYSMNRRTAIVSGAALAFTGLGGLLHPLRAQVIAPTQSMRGGSNNYLPGAPVVERIGGGDFWMTGTVRRRWCAFGRAAHSDMGPYHRGARA